MSDFRAIDIFDPRGRVNRSGLLLLAAVMVGAQGSLLCARFVTGVQPGQVIEFLFGGGFFWLGYVALSKRLHDISCGVQCVAIGIAAIAVTSVAAAIMIAAVAGEDTLLPGAPGYLAIAAVIFLPTLAATVWIHCAPGDPHSNRYGPVPGASGFARHERGAAEPLTPCDDVSALS